MKWLMSIDTHNKSKLNSNALVRIYEHRTERRFKSDAQEPECRRAVTFNILILLI